MDYIELILENNIVFRLYGMEVINNGNKWSKCKINENTK